MKSVLTQCYEWIGIKTSPDKKGGEPFFMYLSVVVANFASFTSGLSISWTSPVIPKFKTIENPFNHNVTSTQTAILTSFLSLGAITGPILAGYIADRFGRKITMMLIGLPAMAGFCLLAFTKTVEFWYLARFLLGIGVGCYFAICPMYVAEIAQNHNRAKFGCLFGVFLTLGLFYPFSIGPHLPLQLYAMTCIIPIVVFLIVFGIFMPETPIFLLSKGKIKEAENALVKLRNRNLTEIQEEINEIMTAVEQNNRGKGGFKELVTSQPAKRAMKICIGLVLIQELAGIHAIMAYLKPIFQAGGSKISPDLSTLIFGIAQISSNLVTVMIVEKIGRRILYMISAVGCCIACAVSAVYFFLQTKEFNMEQVFWLPLGCMVAYMMFFSCGLGPLAWSIVGEVFPSNIKGIGSGTTACFSFLASFIVLVTFPILSETLGMSAPFFMYTVVIAIGLFFIYYMVPETKGMTLAEIQETLKQPDQKRQTN